VGYPTWLEEEMRGVESAGGNGEPNLEAVAALEPDLILGYDYHEDIYGELSEIAATAAIRGSVTEDWKLPFRNIAEVVGKGEKAERVVADYEERLERFRREAGVEGATVSLVNLRDDEVRLYGEGSYPAEIMRDAGLAVAPQPEVESELAELTDNRIVSLSLELIPEIKGDYIFLITYDDLEEARLEELRNNQLWQQLEAVREGRVFVPEAGLAYTNGGPSGADRVVDDLFEYLT
jgi:iron complex transport system substrate-binding protein